MSIKYKKNKAIVLKYYYIYVQLIFFLGLSAYSLSAHSFHDIDLDLYDIVNLKPTCDSLTVTYVTGESVPLQAICQPYKLAVEQPDGWGGYITLW